MKSTKIISFNKNSIEIKYLCAADEKLNKLINSIGTFKLILKTNYFQSLIRQIIGQQLSTTVSKIIWMRLKKLVRNPSPSNILVLKDHQLRAVGLSKNKIKYIKNISEKLVNNELDLYTLDQYSDAQIINKLIALLGVGFWTSKMFLIFSLGRKDVLSEEDIGLRRGIKWLYDLDDEPSSKTLKILSEKWKPYRSVASLYIWEIVNRKFNIDL